MRSFRPLGLAAIAFVAVVLLAPSARAEHGIVLESYTGTRPSSAATVLSPVLDELAARKFLSGPDVVGRKFESQVSRPAATAEGLPTDFANQIESGHKAWIMGDFDEAVSILGPAVEAAHRNSGDVIQRPELREKVLKALIALSLSQHRRGDLSAARESVGELVRSFPTAQVDKAIYGPQAATFFAQVKQDLMAQPRGRLLIKLDDDSAEVFVNEHLEGRGTMAKDLLPGEYRVGVRLGDALSRVHRVVIRASGETKLAIDTGLDAVVHTSPGWTGFLFDSAAEREQSEAKYAAAFAGAVNGAGVIVVGIDEVHGRPAIVGSLVSRVNGREIRRASLALEPAPAVERLRALARFLAGEEATADIDVEIAGDATVVPAIGAFGSTGRDEGRSGRWGGWTWIAGGGAVAALATGAVLLALDGTCPDGSKDPNCPDVYNNTAPGWLAVGGGVVLAGVTTYLILTRPKDAPARSAYIVPTGDGGAMAGFATRF